MKVLAVTEKMEENKLNILESRELEEVRGQEALGDIMEHLALYLLEGELCDAKFLWKRIPNGHKESPELTAIWGVGQALWLRDMPEFYQRAKSFEWSPPIQGIMSKLIGRIFLPGWLSTQRDSFLLYLQRLLRRK